MQLGHIALALSIASYDWSFGNAAFCMAMHYLPNGDSLVKRAGLDSKLIKLATRLESLVTSKRGRNDQNSGSQNDAFWVENGGFHCTVTHSIFFAVLVSGFTSLFSLHYAIIAFVAILAHYMADIGSTVGLPLLWPFSRKKYTLSLFEDTGWWGKDMFIGYYKQPMAWALEGAVVVFLSYRLIRI